jgi:hypothetical protein
MMDRNFTDRLRLLGIAVVAVSGVRLYAARAVGFGDSEALYACYALFPAPAYLDHPGLIGTVMRILGSGNVPTPETVHTATALFGAVVPALFFFTARALGASRETALVAAWPAIVVPEFCIGLFAMTPDTLLLAPWLLSIACAARGLRVGQAKVRDGALHPFVWYCLAGVLAGLATTAKITGALLFVVLMLAYTPCSPRTRGWAYLGLLPGLILVFPMVRYEAAHGYPMFVHRFVDTQHGAGISIRNVAAVVGGQLLYVTPPFVVLAGFALRGLVRRRDESPVLRLLFLSVVVPLTLLTAFSAWSRVAEPHWLAPAYLGLILFVALDERALVSLGTGALARWGSRIGVALSAAVHAFVLVPESTRLVATLDMKLNIASELFGWREAAARALEFARGDEESVVVGPHWTVCAQLRAALPRSIPVSCLTDVADDFDTWSPRAGIQRAPRVIFVSDNRFPNEHPKELSRFAVETASRYTAYRGGRPIRVFSFTVYEKQGVGLLEPQATPRSMP